MIVQNPKTPTQNYVKNQFNQSSRGVGFDHKLPRADGKTVGILNRMLTFNPHKRIKMQEAMTHDFFDVILRLGVTLRSQFLLLWCQVYAPSRG